MDKTIPILSLIVAIFAVIVGPFISLFIAQRQIKASLSLAYKQITGPMRQSWINELRNLLAELSGRALHYYVAGCENRIDAEYQELTLLEHKIALMLNPSEDDHKRLEESIRKLLFLIGDQGSPRSAFPDVHKEVIELSRSILKREWNRVKERCSKRRNMGKSVRKPSE